MTATDRDSGLLDTKHAAAYLGVSRRTLFDLSHPRGPIPVVRPTVWSVRYVRADLDEYIRSRREGGAP